MEKIDEGRGIRELPGQTEQRDDDRLYDLSDRYSALNKLILRDLNKNARKPSFFLYSKEDIQRYLADPYTYQKQLRAAVVYIYGASSHFRRLIQYFVGLSDLAYIIEPYKIDPRKANTKTIGNNYRKVLNTLSSMSIKTQIPKILTVCLREDVFYGTLWQSSDSIVIQQLPSDYCSITTVEGNVPNVTFDFSYFDSRNELLEFYPEEFRAKYEQHRTPGRGSSKWIELDSPNSFAIKCNTDILEYALPPFVGLLRELYDIEDYKQLKEARAALENYAMIAMTLPMDSEGRWLIDYDKAKSFWKNLDDVLPEELGSILSPMKLEKISFEKSNTGDVDTVSEAEQHMFSAAGVSSLLDRKSVV